MQRCGVVAMLVLVASAATLYLHAPGKSELTALSASFSSSATSSLVKAHRVLSRMDRADLVIENGIPTLQLAQYSRKQRRRHSSKHAARTIQLDYSDPYHHEPYDQVPAPPDHLTTKFTFRFHLTI